MNNDKDKPSKLSDILSNLPTIDDLNKDSSNNKSYDIRKIFEEMELALISSMHRAFYFHQIQQSKEGFQWEQWQRTKLRELEKYRKRNKKLVEEYNNHIQETINREIQGNFIQAQDNFEKLINEVKIQFPEDIKEPQSIREYIAKELGKKATPQVEDKFFCINEKKLNALQETVANDLKKAQISVLRKMDDVYRQTIFKTHVYLQSGTKTINQAIDMATKDFLEKGINSITYKDGKQVNIASYAEMCLRTASQRATFLGEGKKRDEYGIHLVVVTAHANTCKMCEPWQGKVLIDDIFSYGTKNDRDYPLLSEALGKGFLHPNCRHTLATYFPGVTRLPVVPNGEDAIKLYEAEQKQRYYERQLRKWKRFKAGTCDEENKEIASKKVKELEKTLKNHLENNRELRRNHYRERI
ncbi:phage minor capsid protein [Clostridium perfringens]|uniref:phage minor capsid protein n=1 Tax=Clostridium perfringens TaxID=1502 RepID=UPI0023F9D8D4|nr:phage minor capsid protein [Clostridium perfringens]WEV19449.1 capsid protein [Clostridium perfringens D]